MGTWCGKAKELLRDTVRVIRTYPSALALPLLLLSLFVGAGLFGYFAFRSFESEGSVNAKDRAQAIASEAAAWWAERVLQAHEPLTLLAALVAQDPHGFLQRFNDSVNQTGNGNHSRYELQLLPNGVVQSVRPAAGAESAALGLNVFTDASPLADRARQSVAEQRAVTWGPAPLPSRAAGDGICFIILQPVFVEGPTVSLARLSPAVNSLCGAPCASNSSSGEPQWWGFVAAVVNVDAIATAPGSPLVLLEQLGYRYHVAVLGGSSSSGSSSRSIGSGGAAPEMPVESSALSPSTDYKEGRAVMEPGQQPLVVAVRISPAAGWAGDDAHTYAVSMLAVLCGMGFVAASLLFGALVSWRRNKMLLETLLPKAVLKDLRGEDTSVLGAAQMRPTDTPADTLLSILADLLEGVTPDLRDVVLVRTAVQRNWDVYTPFNLRSHIKGANLDADVAQALMQQLMGSEFGGTPYDSMYGNGVHGGNGTGHGMRGYSSAVGYNASLSGMGQGSGGFVRHISGLLPYNMDTMAGALQFILSSDASCGDPAPSGSLARPLGAAYAPAAAATAAAVAAGMAIGGGGGGGAPLVQGSLYDTAAAIPEGSSVSLAEIGSGTGSAGGGGRYTISGALHARPSSGILPSAAGPSGRAQSLPPTAPRAAATLQQAAYTADGGAAGATVAAAAAVMPLPVPPLKVMNLRGGYDRSRSQLASSLAPQPQLQPGSPQALSAAQQPGRSHQPQLQPPATAVAAASTAVTDSAFLSPTAMCNGGIGAGSITTGPTAASGLSQASLLLRMSSSGSLMKGMRRPQPQQSQPASNRLQPTHSHPLADALQHSPPALPPPLPAAGSSPLAPFAPAIYRSYTVTGVPEHRAADADAEDSMEESGPYGRHDAADLMVLEAGGTIVGGAPIACRDGGGCGAGERMYGIRRLTRTTEAAHMPQHHHQHHHNSQQYAQHRPGSMILTSTGTGSLLLTVRATNAEATVSTGAASAAGTPHPESGKRSSGTSMHRRPPGRAASFGLPDSPTHLALPQAASPHLQLHARAGRRSVEVPLSTAAGASSAMGMAAGGVGSGRGTDDSASVQSYALGLLHKPASRLGLLRHLQSSVPGSVTASPQLSSQPQQQVPQAPQLNRQQSTASTVAAAAAAAVAGATATGAGSPTPAQLAQAQHAQHPALLSRQRKAASHDRLSRASLPHHLDLSPFLTTEADAAGAAGSNRAVAIAPSQLLASPAPLGSQTIPLTQQPCILEVERLLAKSDNWEFDMWELQDVTQGHALSVLGFYLIQRAGLMDRFKIKPVKVARLLRAIESGYVDNPYHSAIHAADVLQTMHVIIHAAQLHVHYLDALGLLASYYAAIVHDFAHPGLTGDFLIASSDPLAIRYNDRSPLENHHCAASFGLLRRPELNALAPLSQSERNAFRKQVIELVLATDMKQHFSILSHFNTVHRLAAYSQQGQQADSPHVQQPSPKQLFPSSGKGGAQMPGQLQSRASAEESLVVVQLAEGSLPVQADAAASAAASAAPPPQPVDDTERLLSLQLALKCADIGHLGESLEVHNKWLSNLEEEFFRQGDKERELGIPISPLFDRSKQGVSKSQVGFYDFVALPLVHALSSAFPGSKPLMRCFLQNYHNWKEAADVQ